MSDLTKQELNELQVELDQIGEDFADLEDIFGKEAFGFTEDDDSSEALGALDAELQNTELISLDSQSAGAMSLMALADGEIDELSFTEQGWFPNPFRIIKKKAAKLIRKLVRLVKRYKKYAKCVPNVTKAVILFKARKFGSALKKAYSAYRCIKRA